jgi:hypothetical protein
LRGATAGELFDGYCRRLSAMGVVIMRAYVSTQTLHPQWTGYGYTWRRELRSVREQQFARGPISQEWLSSPFNALIQRSLAGEKNPWLRRRLELGPEQRDFPALTDFYAAGATRAWRPQRRPHARSRPPMPLALTDDEYPAVQATAAPIHPHQRDAFLKALAVELSVILSSGRALCTVAPRPCRRHLSSPRIAKRRTSRDI